MDAGNGRFGAAVGSADRRGGYQRRQGGAGFCSRTFGDSRQSQRRCRPASRVPASTARSVSGATSCISPKASRQRGAIPACSASGQQIPSLMTRSPARKATVLRAGRAPSRDHAAHLVAGAVQHLARQRADRDGRLVKIDRDRQQGAVADPPARDHRLRSDRFRSLADAAGNPRHDEAVAQREQVLVECQRLGVRWLLALGPAWHRLLERLASVGIRDRLAACRVGERGEMLKLAAASLAHQLRQLRIVVGEEQEGRLRAPLLAHEQHRDERAEQQQRGGRPQRLGVGQGREPVAERAIADLVVVLQADHEGRRRQMSTRLAARLAVMRRHFPLIGKALGHATGEQSRRVLEILVVAFVFAGQQHVQAMMYVVGPLRVELSGGEVGSLVALMLQDEMHVPAGLDGAADRRRHLVEEVGLA